MEAGFGAPLFFILTPRCFSYELPENEQSILGVEISLKNLCSILRGSHEAVDQRMDTYPLGRVLISWGELKGTQLNPKAPFCRGQCQSSETTSKGWRHCLESACVEEGRSEMPTGLSWQKHTPGCSNWPLTVHEKKLALFRAPFPCSEHQFSRLGSSIHPCIHPWPPVWWHWVRGCSQLPPDKAKGGRSCCFLQNQGKNIQERSWHLKWQHFCSCC